MISKPQTTISVHDSCWDFSLSLTVTHFNWYGTSWRQHHHLVTEYIFFRADGILRPHSRPHR